MAPLVEMVASSGLFDLDHYRKQRPEGPKDRAQAIADYLKSGWRAGLDPGPGFSTRYYLETYDDVRERGCNPLLHYIADGRSEGRSPAPRVARAGAAPAPRPTAPTEDEWDALPPVGPDRPLVDVIVPIYRGYAETLRCLHSALAAPQRTPWRLVAIDDCSPHRGLRTALRRLAERGLIDLHRTPENLGFIGACNLAMSLHPGRDVVLLNSDTQVFGDWLDRLRAAATATADVATVTPFSNNAAICSYPVFCQDNWTAMELADAELDRLAATVNRGATAELPTGVGSCMYIRRACLDQIGMFDEVHFGRGYGEENDLCWRAAKAGWRNLLAADTFVRHYGGVSFGESTAMRKKAAQKTLDRLHPDYPPVVQAFIAEDPIRPLREALDVARLGLHAGSGATLVVGAAGGATERDAREPGAPVFYCRPAEEIRRIRVEAPASPDTVNLPTFDLAVVVDAFAGFLRRIGVRRLQVRDLKGLDLLAIDFMRVAAQQAGLPYEVMVHDYQAICPRMNLIDGSGVYCGEPPVSACQTCVERHGSPFGVPVVWRWREDWKRLLEGADRVVVPDRDVADRLARYTPTVAFTVTPHQCASIGTRSPAQIRPRGALRRIALVGDMGPGEGAALLVETAKAARAEKLPLEFIVAGATDRDGELERIGNVRVMGHGRKGGVVEQLRVSGASLVWLPAVWPRTTCDDLTAALQASLFPVVFNLGAPAARVKAMGWGAVWPLAAMLEPRALARRLLEQAASPPPRELQAARPEPSDQPRAGTQRGSSGGRPDLRQ